MARFLLAVLIGIGATLAWQTYSDEAKQIFGTWATETVRSWASATGRVSTDDAAVAQPASVLDTAATPPRAAAASLDVAQQLEAVARDLAVVRGSIEQLAAKQEQMVQDIHYDAAGGDRTEARIPACTPSGCDATECKCASGCTPASRRASCAGVGSPSTVARAMTARQRPVRCRQVVNVDTFRHENVEGRSARRLYERFGFQPRELTEFQGAPRQRYILTRG
jgi:hypothetical protein